jgi:hypothetical protein
MINPLVRTDYLYPETGIPSHSFFYDLTGWIGHFVNVPDSDHRIFCGVGIFNEIFELRIQPRSQNRYSSAVSQPKITFQTDVYSLLDRRI